MDAQRLGTILAVVGAMLVGAAFIWWATYYAELMRFMEVKGQALPLGCLLFTSAECGLMGGVKMLFNGGTPYSPAVFWLGAIVGGVGLAIRASATNRK